MARGSRVTWSNFWKRPEVIFPVLAGAALSVWGVTAAQPPKDPVAECHKHHPDAKGTPVPVGGQSGTFLVEGCRQPGLAGVGDDALWKADLSVYRISGSSLADEFTDIEVYDTGCPALGIDYKFDNMGTVSRHRIGVQNQQTVAGNSDDPKYIYELRNTLPENVPDDVREMAGSRLLVLINGRYQLESVSCEDFTAAAKPPSVG